MLYMLLLSGAQQLLSFTCIATLRAFDALHEMYYAPRSTGIGGVHFSVLRGIYCAGSGEMLVTFSTWEGPKYI